MSVGVRIVVASQSFGSRYQALMHAQLRRAFQDGESMEDCVIERPREPEFLRQRMLALLEGPTRPAAFIGICLCPDPRTVADLRAAGVPVVLIDEEIDGASTVACDNRAGGYLVGQHLLRGGRKSIAVLAGPRSHYNAARRVSGLTKAFTEQRLAFPDEALLEAPSYSRTDGEAAMERLLREGRKVDAVFCAAGDTCALGMLSVARELRVSIPKDLAVIGFDDIPLAAVAQPPLSTVRQPLDAIGKEAHRLATRCTAEILQRPRRSLLEPTLVLRSTG